MKQQTVNPWLDALPMEGKLGSVPANSTANRSLGLAKDRFASRAPGAYAPTERTNRPPSPDVLAAGLCATEMRADVEQKKKDRKPHEPHSDGKETKEEKPDGHRVQRKNTPVSSFVLLLLPPDWLPEL